MDRITRAYLNFQIFLKSEGKEVERKRKKMKRYGGREGLIVNKFLGVEIFSGGLRNFRGGAVEIFSGGGGIEKL